MNADETALGDDESTSPSCISIAYHLHPGEVRELNRIARPIRVSMVALGAGLTLIGVLRWWWTDPGLLPLGQVILGLFFILAGCSQWIMARRAVARTCATHLEVALDRRSVSVKSPRTAFRCDLSSVHSAEETPLQFVILTTHNAGVLLPKRVMSDTQIELARHHLAALLQLAEKRRRVRGQWRFIFVVGIIGVFIAVYFGLR